MRDADRAARQLVRADPARRMAAARPSVDERPEGIPGSGLSGPYPVGQYAAALRERLREFSKVQVFGEIFGFKQGRAKVWFELRDARGALPCSMWSDDFAALGIPATSLGDGAQVVVAGGCDYYPGSRTASPSFSFAVSDLRVAGDGDLLAQLDRLRKALSAAGLFEPQKRLARPSLPRTIGVVCGETGKARDDVLAGLQRRGWQGRLVWAFAPVQDRHAAPAITSALQDLAACGGVDVIIVARGGGSLADLFAFCDETLCRTVALLPVPVISSVGHHTDRTLIDDVAAVSCSTPTHAAEAAVPVDCEQARAAAASLARRLERAGARAILERARGLMALSRAPAEHVERHRRALRQHGRELDAAARRSGEARARQVARDARRLEGLAARAASDVARRAAQGAALAEAVDRSGTAAASRRRADLERLALALSAHHPQRTLERGYALVTDAEGEPVGSAERAAGTTDFNVQFHDGAIRVRRSDGDQEVLF